MKPPIIDRSDLQTLQHKTVTGVFTLVFWAFWGYLWLPLLALVAWTFGLQLAYKYMIVLGGYREILTLLSWYALVIVLLGCSLVAWATYNIRRYSQLTRRLANRPVPIEQVARYFRQGPLAVESWRQAQRLYVTLDEKGAIARVEILAAGTPVPQEPLEIVQE